MNESCELVDGRHPIIKRGPALTVCYLFARGRCHARDFVEDNPTIRVKLMAIVAQLAEQGVIRVRERGHKLKGEKYSGLLELKPGAGRIMAFRDGRVLYLTNGVKKAQRKVQKRDYDLAASLRDEYFANVAQGERVP